MRGSRESDCRLREATARPGARRATRGVRSWRARCEGAPIQGGTGRDGIGNRANTDSHGCRVRGLAGLFKPWNLKPIHESTRNINVQPHSHNPNLCARAIFNHFAKLATQPSHARPKPACGPPNFAHLPQGQAGRGCKYSSRDCGGVLETTTTQRKDGDSSIWHEVVAAGRATKAATSSEACSLTSIKTIAALAAARRSGPGSTSTRSSFSCALSAPSRCG